jgi:hypothetical protein
MSPSNPTSALLVAFQMRCPLTESCLGAPALYVLSLWLALAGNSLHDWAEADSVLARYSARHVGLHEVH